MNDKCPKCGADFENQAFNVSGEVIANRYRCGTEHWTKPMLHSDITAGPYCLRRQLAASQAENAALEAKNARLRAALEKIGVADFALEMRAISAAALKEDKP